MAFLQSAVTATDPKGSGDGSRFLRGRALIAQDGGDAVALLDDVDAFAGGIAAGDLIFGLGQQRDVFRDHAGFKPGIRIARGTLGGVGQFEIRAACIGGGASERGVSHAAAAAPVGGIAHAHQDLVQRNHRGKLRLWQDQREILCDKGNLRIGLDCVGNSRIVGGRRSGGPDIAQHALGVERRDLGAEIAGGHR